MKEKIDYYLTNEDERNRIAMNGLQEVQKYNRDEWAKEIARIYQEELNDEGKG